MIQARKNTAEDNGSRQVWAAANFYVAFKRDQMGKKRETPFYWRPDANEVQLNARPEDKEVFARIKSNKQPDTEDVHIALRPNFIGLMREDSIGWQNVIVEERCVRVITNNGAFVSIAEDGSFFCDHGDDLTTVERTGRVIKRTQYLDAVMSADGQQFANRLSDAFFSEPAEDSAKQPQRRTARRVWDSAEFYMAFHKDKMGNARNRPFHWTPERSSLLIDQNPEDKEAFIHLRSTKQVDSEDVHIALRPDFIGILREVETGWQSIVVYEREVNILMADGTMIRIDLLGSVARLTDTDETEVSHLAEVRKWSGDQVSYMSHWGDDFVRVSFSEN